MEFIIGTQFSREFNFEETLITEKLRNILNEKISTKSYSNNLKKVYLDFICISKDFESFFTVRPLKILKKESAIEYEIKLDFEIFFNSNSEERFKILCNEFLIKSRIILSDKKLKEFELENFIYDLEDSLKEIE
ncbi:hypothetical protein [Flavobacterium terrae]|uniref:Immunity protein 44 n=1 Tax=Flavobacterium terrae TaxID=415425 RepID=A0A1M6DD65_9FLAO|nr:hypothetical protein [Flavobacterium terrae]SHI71139.1 hypothetical protein SAMN05444363_1376 [Flavobacterium terrae]